jgi:hypothetical protein
LGAAIWLDTKGFDKSGRNVRWIELDLYVFNLLSTIGTINKDFYLDLENHKYDLKANLELGLDFIFNKDLKNFEYKLNQNFLNLIKIDKLSKQSSNNFKAKIKWASLQIDYFEMNNYFTEEKLLNYFQAQSSPFFITNSEYKKKYRLLTIYYNDNRESFTNEFLELFVSQFESKLGSDIKEKVDTGRTNYKIYILNLESSRKTLEPLFRNIFE